jgi:hypothetical protein
MGAFQPQHKTCKHINSPQLVGEGQVNDNTSKR